MFAANKRSQMLGHATSAMRQLNLPGNKGAAPPAAAMRQLNLPNNKGSGSPAAAPPTNHTANSQTGSDVPIRVKIEALEIAIGALSERLGDLAEQSVMGLETDSGGADIAQLKTQVSAFELSVTDLRSEIQECRTLCAAIPHPYELDAVQQSELMATMAIATQMVHATVTEATTWVYANKTGDPEQDIDGPSHVLPARSRVRMVFPQYKHQDGSLYMGAVWVDSTNMRVNTGWVCLTDASLNEPRLCNFTV